MIKSLKPTVRYATSFRFPGPSKFGGKFGGPLVHARSWTEAEFKAARLGCIVDGIHEGFYKVDPITNELVLDEHYAVTGCTEERRYAMNCGIKGRKKKIRLYISIYLRALVYKLYNLIEKLDPIESRKNVVHFR